MVSRSRIKRLRPLSRLRVPVCPSESPPLFQKSSTQPIYQPLLKSRIISIYSNYRLDMKDLHYNQLFINIYIYIYIYSMNNFNCGLPLGRTIPETYRNISCVGHRGQQAGHAECQRQSFNEDISAPQLRSDSDWDWSLGLLSPIYKTTLEFGIKILDPKSQQLLTRGLLQRRGRQKNSKADMIGWMKFEFHSNFTKILGNRERKQMELKPVWIPFVCRRNKPRLKMTKTLILNRGQKIHAI